MSIEDSKLIKRVPTSDFEFLAEQERKRLLKIRDDVVARMAVEHEATLIAEAMSEDRSVKH